MPVATSEVFLNRLQATLRRVHQGGLRAGRPFCTLTYAQSLDGSIALHPMRGLPLSSRESLEATHRLRSWHDAILVGIRTVLADDPSLTVRLVSGRHPQPVVLDSCLRMPLDARLVRSDAAHRPACWVASTGQADVGREQALVSRGVTVFRFPADANGWVPLLPLLAMLARMGIRSLMVEGGARVLSSFLRARLADRLVVTVAPCIVGGVPAFASIAAEPTALPRLDGLCWAPLGRDWMVSGQPVWDGS
jgi:3,4-dihydroxy 2-butanone 4-phosphate synthase/GTP cyclohydrolase II